MLNSKILKVIKIEDPEQLRLIFKGKVLSLKKTLVAENLTNDSKIIAFEAPKIIYLDENPKYSTPQFQPVNLSSYPDY